jgi:hypothetical protein
MISHRAFRDLLRRGGSVWARTAPGQSRHTPNVRYRGKTVTIPAKTRRDGRVDPEFACQNHYLCG